MRNSTLVWMLSVVVLLPNVGTAQILTFPNPYPQTNAADAVWQRRGEPIFFAGSFYYPAGPTVFFDGNVMQRTGTYEGIPLYEDATQSPFSVVYVPIGGNVLRPYERRRIGELVGTVGSQTPSFPFQTDGEISVGALPGGFAPPIDLVQPVVPGFAPPVNANVVITPSIPSAAPARGIRRADTPIILQVWVPFNGGRWYSAGPAVSYSPDRFVKIGEYQGFPVYRDRRRTTIDEIYVPSVADGPVAPYKKR